jgi:hypothetical protein
LFDDSLKKLGQDFGIAHHVTTLGPFLLGIVIQPGAQQRSLSMCDYSLHHVQSRAARVGDKLTTRNFGTGTRGFAAPEDLTTAVCVLPGTEIAFDREITFRATSQSPAHLQQSGYKAAIFRQVNQHLPMTHHDALELPDGHMILLTDLSDGQSATVLQLPAQPSTATEVTAQRRVEYIGG